MLNAINGRPHWTAALIQICAPPYTRDAISRHRISYLSAANLPTKLRGLSPEPRPLYPQVRRERHGGEGCTRRKRRGSLARLKRFTLSCGFLEVRCYGLGQSFCKLVLPRTESPRESVPRKSAASSATPRCAKAATTRAATSLDRKLATKVRSPRSGTMVS